MASINMMRAMDDASPGHHLEHAAAHFEELLDGPQELNKDEARTALSHAICRLALVWAKSMQK